MEWDVLFDGFKDEYDMILLEVRGAKGPLRAQGFLGANPMPLVFSEDELPKRVCSALGIEAPRDPKTRHVLIAAPESLFAIDVFLRDDAGETEPLVLGKPRHTGMTFELQAGEDEEQSAPWVLRELVIQKLREAPCLLWDRGVIETSDAHVMRFWVTMRTDDPQKAKALATEPLVIRQLDSRAKKLDLPLFVLEDATERLSTGVWERHVTLSVRVPKDLKHFTIWVWSRTLENGSFRGYPRWLIDSIAHEAALRTASVEHEARYDDWEKAREALAQPETQPRATRPHLSVIVADNALGWAKPEQPERSILAAFAPQRLRKGIQRREIDRARAQTYASLKNQTYQDFKVRTVSSNEPLGRAVSVADPTTWYVVVESGDVLVNEALERLAQKMEDPNVRLVYGDEDVAFTNKTGKTTYGLARLKPRFSADELYFGHGLGLPLAIRADVWTPDSSGVYELALSAFEASGEKGVAHAESVLLHAHADRPFASVKAVKPLARHLERRGLSADVTFRETNPSDDPARHPGGVLRVRYFWRNATPKVSIIIPNRDHSDYLEPCVRSILERTTWENYEVVIVENGSVEDATMHLYAELQKDPRVRVVGWRGVGFNYPAIVNRGAEKATGDLVCLLNNDTEVLDGDWLSELAGPLSRPEIGVTGALLCYADGLIQHAGMMAVPEGGLAHQQQNLWPGTLERGGADGAEGYLMSLQRPVAYTMVTGACQMIRRDVWEELGGYDERLAVGFNDADFCLRAAEAGYHTLFTPYARLRHKEFGTRRRESGEGSEQKRWQAERAHMMKRYPRVFTRDPFLNEALDPDSRYFSLKRIRWPHETRAWLGWPILSEKEREATQIETAITKEITDETIKIPRAIANETSREASKDSHPE